jgi:cytochrome d ubiquinol oxidase subunit II
VVRGAPLDRDGEFFLPLWTIWRPGAQPGILDWYPVPVAAAALAGLTLHGAARVALRTDGALEARSRRLAGRVW